MIVAAAVRYNGLIYHQVPPARHHDVIHEMATVYNLGPEAMHDQGFLDRVHGAYRFVDRKEALVIAKDQIRDKHGNPNELYSEDLW